MVSDEEAVEHFNTEARTVVELVELIRACRGTGPQGHPTKIRKPGDSKARAADEGEV
jgi:hypothetical protein